MRKREKVRENESERERERDGWTGGRRLNEMKTMRRRKDTSKRTQMGMW